MVCVYVCVSLCVCVCPCACVLMSGCVRVAIAIVKWPMLPLYVEEWVLCKFPSLLLSDKILNDIKLLLNAPTLVVASVCEQEGGQGGVGHADDAVWPHWPPAGLPSTYAKENHRGRSSHWSWHKAWCWRHCEDVTKTSWRHFEETWLGIRRFFFLPSSSIRSSHIHHCDYFCYMLSAWFHSTVG